MKERIKDKDFLTKEHKDGKPELGLTSKYLIGRSARKYVAGNDTFEDSTFEVVLGEV